MPALPIKGFRGIDRRKFKLEGLPGSLYTLENAHINAGGDIEKRKQFSWEGTLPDGCFGLEVQDGGLVTFGSDTPPISNLPSGVTYVQIKHPAVYYGDSYSAGSHDMTAVPWSTNFQGKAVVVATFSDTRTFVYYNAIPIPAFSDGISFNAGSPLEHLGIDLGRTFASLGSDWQVRINQEADSGTALSPTTLNGSVIVKSPPGVHFVPTLTYDADNGLFSCRLLDQNDGATTGPDVVVRAVGAIAGFTCTTVPDPGTGTISVSASRSKTDATHVVLGAYSASSRTPAQIAEGVYNAINARTWITGYSAVWAGGASAVVTVQAPSSWGNFTDYIHITTTGDWGAVYNAGSSATGATLVTDTTSLRRILKAPAGGTIYFQGMITASYTGTPVGTIAYLWETDTGGAGGINMATYNDAGVLQTGGIGRRALFTKMVAVGSQAVGYFKCTLTDNGVTKNTVHCSVVFSAWRI